jgi:hypothetical protein
VVDVVGIDVSVAIAAGKAAALVSAAKRPPKRGGDGAGTPSDVKRLAVALCDHHEGGVAGQAAGGLGGQRRALLELTSRAPGARVARGMVRSAGQGARVGVQDDLAALCTRARGGRGRQ